MSHLPPTPFSGPPFGTDTDEAVSALLDGELAGFAAARGLEEAEAVTRLEAWSGLSARLEELQGASREVAAAADLDERTRRRLVGAALTARDADLPRAPRRPRSRDHRRRVGWRAAAAVAAVVVVAALAVVLVGRDDGGRRQADSAGSGAAAADAPRGFLGDVGDVTDAAVLRRLLGGQAVPAPSPSGAADASTTAPAAAQRDAVEPTAAIARCASGVAGDAPVRFSATAISGGEPAYVIGITREGRTIAFVVDAADCSIVGSVSR